MINVLGGITGGLGLFFFGMWLLTENLKTLTGRRLRMTVARWVGHPMAAYSWGAIIGAATQSATAMTFIIVSLLRSELVPIHRALLLILGGNLGNSLIVLVVTLDIKLAALYVMGIAGMVMATGKMSGYRPLAGFLFGISLMIFSLFLVKESASSLIGHPWFHMIVGSSKGTLIFAFLGAALLAFLVQSSGAVSIFGIGLAAGGLLSIDQTIMLIYGSWLGASVVLCALAMNLTGRSRQVAMYQLMYVLVVCLIMVPMFYIELYFDVPFMKALILAIDLPVSQQLALIVLYACLPGLPVMFAITRPCTRLLENGGRRRMWSSYRRPSLFMTVQSAMSILRWCWSISNSTVCWGCYRATLRWCARESPRLRITKRLRSCCHGSMNSSPPWRRTIRATAPTTSRRCWAATSCWFGWRSRPQPCAKC